MDLGHISGVSGVLDTINASVAKLRRTTNVYQHVLFALRIEKLLMSIIQEIYTNPTFTSSLKCGPVRGRRRLTSFRLLYIFTVFNCLAYLTVLSWYCCQDCGLLTLLLLTLPSCIFSFSLYSNHQDYLEVE